MIVQIEEDTGTLPPSLPRGVPPEVAAANADVQAIIVPRLTMLMEIANTFLSTIIESMETVPYGIRWICKQIRSLTRVSVASRCRWRLRCFSVNTRKRRMPLYARSSADSSSCGLSTRQSSRRRRICWWTGFRQSTPDGR
jgi:hypothetical protein